MNHPTPQGLPVRDLTDDEKQFLHYNPNTSDLVEFVQAYAREALAAQAATLESIHKIIECAGPEAADEIADLLGYPSVEWPSDQALTAPNLACKSAQARLATQWGYVRAASVEPVGRVARVEWCAHEQKWRHVIWADKKVPFGTPVFASSPSPASVQNASLVEKLAKRTCEANADSARFTIALQTLRASLDPDDWMGAVTMHNYIDAVLAGGSPLQQHPAPSPAQAVDAVDEREAGHVGDTRFEGWLSESVHKGSMYLKQDMRDSYWAGYQERAALQAARQPQAQQGGVESEEAQNYRWLRAHGAANSKQGSTAFDGDALRLGFQFMYWCDPGKLDQLITQKRAALAAKEPK